MTDLDLRKLEWEENSSPIPYERLKNSSLVVFGPATSSNVEFMLESSSSTSSTTESVAESASPECTDLLNQISSLCVQFLGKAGKEIPPQWSMSDLLQTVVIGEEDMGVSRPFLADTYYVMI